MGQMSRTERTQLEARLAAQLRTPAATPPPELLAAVQRAAARVRRPPAMAPFVAGQVRFVQPRSWALLVGGIALVWAVATYGESTNTVFLAQGAAGVLCALAALLELVSARAYGMDELEGSCLMNAHAVVCARLVIMGCAGALALATGVALCADAEPVWALAAHTALPYFAVAAGGLVAARHSSATSSLAAALLWAALVCAACLVLASAVPGAFRMTSAGIWVAAALAAAAWCAREVAYWLSLAAAPAELNHAPAAF